MKMRSHPNKKSKVIFIYSANYKLIWLKKTINYISDNQKSLLSFFAKKSPRKSDIKLQLKESKPLFRCIGFSSQNSYQQKFQNEYLNYFDSFLQKINSTEIIPIEILSFLKNETLQIKISQRRPIQSQKRKISLFFSDSLRKYNGVLCELVAKRVKGRKPLEKEDFINYEIDSDEEIEEQVKFLIIKIKINLIKKTDHIIKKQNATDISSDEKEIEEEDDDSEEEDEKFVVPDGYLSQEEKLDEDGGFFYNKFLFF